MLSVEVLVQDETRLLALVRLVRGEEVHPERRTTEGAILAHVLMTDEQYAEAQRAGFQCRVLVDYSKQPDPRDEVSKTNRFEAELQRIRSGAKGT